MQSTYLLEKYQLHTILLFMIFLGVCPAKSEEVNYHLTNGDRISGELVKEESSNKIKVLISPLLGKIRLNTSSIVSPEETLPPTRWSTEFSVGLNSSTTDKNIDSNYSLGISTTYSGKYNSLSLDADYQYDEVTENNKISTGASNGSLDLRNDFINKGKYNFYTDIEYDYDALNTSGINRTIASFGISKAFLETPNSSLILSAGPAVQWSSGGANALGIVTVANLITHLNSKQNIIGPSINF